MCGDICPYQAIRYEKNKEGFAYPTVDAALCVECGLCEKKCPALHTKGRILEQAIQEMPSLEAYAIINLEEDVRAQSSSGGVFSVLAEDCFAKGGSVWGAAFNDAWTVHHTKATDTPSLLPLRSSKYAQSCMEGVYKQVKDELLAGKQVLFSGTPCQAEALMQYLGRPFDNLLLVDLFCHGVSSPGLFERYLEEVHADSHITSISFRDKSVGWERYGMCVQSDQGRYYAPYLKDPFLLPFCNAVSLRESCYTCSAKGYPRASDITLGDFWKVNMLDPTLNDQKGVSLVLVHTARGRAWIEALEAKDTVRVVPISQQDLVRLNGASGTPVKRPSGRDAFFAAAFSGSIRQAANQYAKTPLKQRVMSRLRKALVKMGIYEFARGLKKKLKKH